MKRDLFPDAPAPTPDEAREALHRFCASHFRNSKEPHARTSIPTQPDDDDILLDRFIDYAEKALAERDTLARALIDLLAGRMLAPDVIEVATRAIEKGGA